ncbi:ADP-ribosylation factor-like protein 6 [Clavelina lepadiformis]|uniref:ADP-ribosylation factor-like protein 6 n=1 Tax=Clavelina lepadiformis TaxID=159417 RepID=UPI004042C2C1
MGWLEKLANWLQVRKKEASILCIGLDNSGKSTIINKLKPANARIEDVVPTVGFNVETFSTGKLFVTAYDMSGQGRYRNLWERYYKNCDAVVFVVDSTDKLRMAVAKEELSQLLNHREMKRKKNLPVLFFANKCDLRQSCSAVKCAQLLALDRGEWTRGGSPVHKTASAGPGRPWHICESNALTGEGLQEGIQWLTDQLMC